MLLQHIGMSNYKKNNIKNNWYHNRMLCSVCYACYVVHVATGQWLCYTATCHSSYKSTLSIISKMAGLFLLWCSDAMNYIVSCASSLETCTYLMTKVEIISLLFVFYFYKLLSCSHLLTTYDCLS